MSKIIVSVFYLFLTLLLMGKDYHQEVLLENYWSDNKMNFTRKKISGDDGSYRTIPYSFEVNQNSIFFFEKETRNVYRFNSESGKYGSFLPDKEERSRLEFSQDFRKKITPDEVNIFFDKENLRFYIHNNFCIGYNIYSPSRRFEKEKVSHLMNEVYSFNIKNKLIKIIDSDYTPFGFILVGIDSYGRIYSTTDFYYLRQILIHDKNGNYIDTLSIKSDQFGKDASLLPPGRKLNHIPKITPNGDIYIMLRKEKGIFVVKYDMSELPIESDGTIEKVINWARNGIPEPSPELISADLKTYLDQASQIELRRFRNSLFALKGYTFKSQDLTDYFMPFPWYEPKEGVKSDVSSLTENQQNLLKIIRYYENKL